ncbi:MAG: Spy/CpxP family protein refolding chaperone [Puniceicoccales bacterium]
MKKTLLSLFAVSFAALSFTGFYRAIASETHNGVAGDGVRFERILGRAANALELTEEQQEGVRQIWENRKSGILDYAHELRSDREVYRALIQEETLDVTSLQVQIDAMNEARSGLLLEVAELRHEIRSILSDEQKAKIEKFRGKMEARWEKLSSNLGEEGFGGQ